jgi:hypothetical protein
MRKAEILLQKKRSGKDLSPTHSYFLCNYYPFHPSAIDLHQSAFGAMHSRQAIMCPAARIFDERPSLTASMADLAY